jgi:hypothetical protein
LAASLPRLCFPQDRGKIAPAEAKSLVNPSRDCDLRTVAWHAEILAVHPHRSRAVIDLKDARAERAKGIRNPPRYGYFFAPVPPWVVINF